MRVAKATHRVSIFLMLSFTLFNTNAVLKYWSVIFLVLFCQLRKGLLLVVKPSQVKPSTAFIFSRNQQNVLPLPPRIS